MTLYKWSQVAATNGLADSTCNFPEGMAPSAINDGTRGMMAAIAKHRDDISGQITTAGTLNAYTLSSFQQFDSLLDMSGKEVWFTPHVTNGATVTLNVDGLGAKPLRTAPNTELLAGVIIQGTPYGAVYNNTDGAWYLKGFFGNPYNMPLAGGMDFWGTTVPNSNFAFPVGQAISRTTYASLFAIMGTTYGVGDGSTTFNLPNKQGRVSAMIDATTTVINSATMSPDGTTMGAKGGQQVSTLTTPNLPPYTPAGSVAVSGNYGSQVGFINTATSVNVGFGGTNSGASFTAPTINAAFTGTPAPGQNSTPFTNMPPTILCNYILRVL